MYFSSSLFIFEVISVNIFILASYFIIRIAVLDGDADEFEDEETAAEVHELKLNDDGNGSELGKLKQLKALYLYNNKLTGKSCY